MIITFSTAHLKNWRRNEHHNYLWKLKIFNNIHTGIDFYLQLNRIHLNFNSKYNNERFTPQSDAFFLRGGSEGLYASFHKTRIIRIFIIIIIIPLCSFMMRELCISTDWMEAIFLLKRGLFSMGCKRLKRFMEFMIFWNKFCNSKNLNFSYFLVAKTSETIIKCGNVAMRFEQGKVKLCDLGLHKKIANRKLNRIHWFETVCFGLLVHVYHSILGF